MPVAVAALIWEAFVLFVLVTPADNSIPVLIVIGLVLAGGVYFAYMYFFHRETLDTDPGVDNAAVPTPQATA
jgi:phosphotransferase system  glucose/maltose/N-acetylglucosamine-specific IIC component